VRACTGCVCAPIEQRENMQASWQSRGPCVLLCCCLHVRVLRHTPSRPSCQRASLARTPSTPQCRRPHNHIHTQLHPPPTAAWRTGVKEQPWRADACDRGGGTEERQRGVGVGQQVHAQLQVCGRHEAALRCGAQGGAWCCGALLGCAAGAFTGRMRPSAASRPCLDVLVRAPGGQQRGVVGVEVQGEHRVLAVPHYLQRLGLHRRRASLIRSYGLEEWGGCLTSSLALRLFPDQSPAKLASHHSSQRGGPYISTHHRTLALAHLNARQKLSSPAAKR